MLPASSDRARGGKGVKPSVRTDASRLPHRSREPMRLISLNVSLPRSFEWRGQTVTSAIFKEPVPDRRWVGTLNVDGDDQADKQGHGGEHRAVFVYQLESYRYWEQELDRTLGGPGLFGENFTIEGLSDEDVAIGDRFGIGGAIFEVTQPRVTCYKIGIRLEEPRMAALLTGHGRPGFYFRVIEPGEVGARDEIIPLGGPEDRLSVREVSDLLYRTHDEPTLRRALSLTALPDGWRSSFQALLDQSLEGQAGNAGLAGPGAAPPPAWSGFRAFRVAQVIVETPTIHSFILIPTDNEALAPHAPGQFISLRLPKVDGRQLVRSYSLSAVGDTRSLRISVRRDGAASTQLHDAVLVGDVVELGAPRGDFTLDPTADGSAIVLLSAGIGITPILAMLAALARHRSRRRIIWVHVARNEAEHAFREEAAGLLSQLPDVETHLFYTKPDAPPAAGTLAGRLDEAALAALALPADAAVYLCGPDGFMTATIEALGTLGFAEAEIHSERFGAPAPSGKPPHLPDDPPREGPLVTFARSGIEVHFGDPWPNLLEIAEACDVPVSWSCRTGVCHRCENALVSGELAYDPEPLDAPAPGNLLLCCSHPVGAVTLDL
jgi:ferredoxin-NADP reductase/MOSC domain-containing protein YiiM